MKCKNIRSSGKTLGVAPLISTQYGDENASKRMVQMT